MKQLSWIALIAVVVAAPMNPAPKQDVLAMTEKSMLEMVAQMQQAYDDFVAQKIQRPELEKQMKDIKGKLKMTNFDAVGGDPAHNAALRRLSNAMYERAHWLQPQGSSDTLIKDPINWGRYHDVELALLNLRIVKLEIKKE
jgi:hypothetical protein